MKARNELIPALTGVRFLAALAVVLFHFGSARVPENVRWLRNLFESGFVGVNLFFILSGFVLAHAYTPSAPLDRRAFWVGRFARVYPAYFIGLLLFLPFLILTYASDYGSEMGARLLVVVPSTLLLVQAWIPAAAMEWNPPGWSLSAEAFFYLLYPFLAPLVWRSTRRWPIATLIGLWTGQMLPALVSWISYAPIGWGPSTVTDLPSVIVGCYPAARLCGFLAGIALCAVFKNFETDRWLSPEAVTGALLLVLALRPSLPRILVIGGLCDPLLGLLILSLTSTRGWIPRILSTKPMLWLGEASYSLYILHVPVWYWFIWLNANTWEMGTSSVRYFLAYLSFTLAASIALHRAVEVPYRDSIRTWWRRRTDRVRSMPQSES